MSEGSGEERKRDTERGAQVRKILLGVLLVGFVVGGALFAHHLTQEIVTVDVLVIDAELTAAAGPGSLEIDGRVHAQRAATIEFSARRIQRAALPEFTLTPEPFDPEFDDEEDRLAPSLLGFDPAALVAAIPGAERPADPQAARLDEFLSATGPVTVRGFVGRGVFPQGEAPAFWLVLAQIGEEHPAGIIVRAIGRAGELVPYEMILRPPREREQSHWLRLITRRDVREHRLELRFAPPR